MCRTLRAGEEVDPEDLHRREGLAGREVEQARAEEGEDERDELEVGAEDLDANIGADAGREHLDAVDDRLREDVAPAGNLQHPAELVIADGKIISIKELSPNLELQTLKQCL